MTNPVITVPILAVVRNQMIRKFNNQNAVTAERAIVPENYGIKRGILFHRMQRQGVIIAARNDTFYLNIEKEQVFQKRARKIAITIISAMLIFVLTILLVIHYNKN